MRQVNENRRTPGRRENIRRMYDMLHGIIKEEERQQYDRLLLSRHLLCVNRRVQERRSGEDRRVA